MNIPNWINNKTVQWFLGTITVPVLLFGWSRCVPIDASTETKKQKRFSTIAGNPNIKAVRKVFKVINMFTEDSTISKEESDHLKLKACEMFPDSLVEKYDRWRSLSE